MNYAHSVFHGYGSTVFDGDSYSVVEEEGTLYIYDDADMVAIFARGRWDRIIRHKVGDEERAA